MKLVMSLLLIFALSSCASEPIYSSDGTCLTCWNNPLTGAPINHDGDAQKRQINRAGVAANQNSRPRQYSPKAHEVVFSAPVNVDVAYLNIKKEFHYFSEQEIRQEWGSMAGAKMQTFAFAYDATPSVYYRMRADRKHQGVQVIIDHTIEKQSTTHSKITITYWLNDTSINPQTFGDSLQRRVQKTLNL